MSERTVMSDDADLWRLLVDVIYDRADPSDLRAAVNERFGDPDAPIHFDWAEQHAARAGGRP